jgi:hypothetical protein
VTSDNITPLHLINVKRLARELRPYVAVDAPAPQAPIRPAQPSAEEVARAVEAFLADRRSRRRA